METTATNLTRLGELRAREDEILAELAGITKQIERYVARVEHLSPTLRSVRKEIHTLTERERKEAAA